MAMSASMSGAMHLHSGVRKGFYRKYHLGQRAKHRCDRYWFLKCF